jgi:ATP-binding cassette subfamily F protein uup
VLAFEGSAQIDSYIGGYSDYLREKEAAVRQYSKKSKIAAQIMAPVIEKPAAAPAIALSFTEQHELAKLPATITALEQEMHELQGILAADASLYTTDPLRFDKTMRLLARAQKKLEEAEARWLMLEEKASMPTKSG